MLYTYSLPYQTGQISTEIIDSYGYKRVTVECNDLKTAFHFTIRDKKRNYLFDWIKFRGVIRMNPIMKKDGELPERNLIYAHNPLNGSSREEWLFFMLLDHEIQRIPGPEKYGIVQDAHLAMRRLVENWHSNHNSQDLKSIIEDIKKAEAMIGKEYKIVCDQETEEAATVLHVTVTV